MQKSLIDLSSWSESHTLTFFQEVQKLKSSPLKPMGAFWGSVALVFLEPSTRTRLSFERAAHRLGLQTQLVSGSSGSSIEKGESIEETLQNIAAMLPKAIVVRCGDDVALSEIASKLPVPVLCAGWGKQAHPTQALLDAYTLFEKWKGHFKHKRILFVGDMIHSRVLASHRQLLKNLNCQVGYLSPEAWRLPSLHNFEQNFENKKSALEWADAIIGLRWQKERHISTGEQVRFDVSDYQITYDDLKDLPDQPWVMHPGPVGWGEEFSASVKDYAHQLILDQVTSGVFVRACLLSRLGE